MLRMRLIFMAAFMLLLVAGSAIAQQPVSAPGPTGNPPTAGTYSWVIPALGSFAVGLAAFGAALGDGRAISAACEGTARNPGAGQRIFTMLILGLALIETLVLFTFLTVLISG
jgi:F-type H+-transporting ATPase subunit c